MPQKLTRRRFLGQASCAAVTGIPILNTLLNLQLSSSLASAATPPGSSTEYRALICLFLSGGNDSFNMLTPYGLAGDHEGGDAYGHYVTSRDDLALPRSNLIKIEPTNTGDLTFGVHHRMPNLAAMFQGGDAAFVANVGTLIEPVADRSEVFQALKRLPLGLYSHSDQIEQWQTSVPHSRSGLGWAGRMMDLIKDINPNKVVPMNISIDGSNVWQTGVSGAEYAVDPGNAQEVGGAVALSGYNFGYNESGENVLSNATSAAVDSMLAQQYTHLLQGTFQQKRRDALDAYAAYAEATAPDLPGNVTFPATPLGFQLRQVAKAINGQGALGAHRQTFFVNRGGWDHHSETLAMQHNMLKEVDDALGAFWEQLGLMGKQNAATIFSASDFGRTLTSNGRGSDHAWGSNQFVIGGQVQGRQIFGSYPELSINSAGGPEINPLDTGRGRLIPTTSCDEYFAELAYWLGVPGSSMHLVLPNIGNFVSGGVPTLGFLA